MIRSAFTTTLVNDNQSSRRESVYSISTTSSCKRKRLPRTSSKEFQMSLDNPKPRLNRSVSLSSSCLEDWSSADFRMRSNSLPSKTEIDYAYAMQEKEAAEQEERNRHNERRMFAFMMNIAHIVIGVAIMQLGIVGTWYIKFMNFENNMIRHIVYICLLFIVSGGYGLIVLTRRLQEEKAHRIAYSFLTILSILAAIFITVSGLKLTISDSYRSGVVPIVLFDGFVIGLATLEILLALVGLYLTLPHLCARETTSDQSEKGSIVTEPISEHEERKSLCHSWPHIFGVVLNIAHVVLGLCILELGMVGMLYRRQMNFDNSSLIIIVIVSVTFVSIGALGVYNHSRTQRTNTNCNRAFYTLGSLLAVCAATTVLTMASLAVNGEYYFSGFEAIVAFDAMILSISGIEVFVGIATMLLVIVPWCKSRWTTASLD